MNSSVLREMKTARKLAKWIVFALILSATVRQEQTHVNANTETRVEATARAIQPSKHSGASTDSTPVTKSISPRISFEKMVFDLGNVGQGTKNSCEFKFTNTGRGLLKIGNISRTCGCTVFQLDKKEYAPNETGTIKVIYTAGRATGTTQKSIYVPTNDKANPKVKLTVKARIIRARKYKEFLL